MGYPVRDRTTPLPLLPPLLQRSFPPTGYTPTPAGLFVVCSFSRTAPLWIFSMRKNRKLSILNLNGLLEILAKWSVSNWILENQTQITISGFILKWLQLFKLIRYLNVPCIISKLQPQKKCDCAYLSFLLFPLFFPQEQRSSVVGR